MFDTIDGLPVHALVVHAVVVLLPLAVLGTIAIALVPAWRARFGPLVAGVAVVATALCPVATSSGESLAARVGDPGEHAALGDQLVWFAIPMALLAIALVVLDRRARRTAGGPVDDAPVDGGSRRGGGTATATARTTATAVRPRSAVTTAVAVLAVVASLAVGYQTFRVGHSGAEVVWSGVIDATNG